MESPAGPRAGVGGDDAQKLRGCAAGRLPWLLALLVGSVLAAALARQVGSGSAGGPRARGEAERADEHAAAVIVGAPSQYVDLKVWTPEDSQRRGRVWDENWRQLAPDKDWYSANAAFLEALLPSVRAGMRVLELSTGRRGSLARGLALRGPQASVLGTDISSAVVEGLSASHPSSSWPGLSFQRADSFNLQFPDGGRFDLVFEKAGVSDIFQSSVRVLVRLLACIVTRAFDPERGGVFIALMHTSSASQARQGKDVPCKAGLACAVMARRDFNCTVEDVPLRLGFWHRSSGLHMAVVRCGGVAPALARQGCDVAAMESMAAERVA